MFNYHPKGKGLNWRTNLYFMQTPGPGTHVDAPSTVTPCEVPVTDVASSRAGARLRGGPTATSTSRTCVFDDEGEPAADPLRDQQAAMRSGPENGPAGPGPLARREGRRRGAFSVDHDASDNNYDMGSLYLDGETLRVIAPTGVGPQPFNPGGEVEQWVSHDGGETWLRERTLTAESTRNHTYVRRPVDAHPGFLALWADGDARAPSTSALHFTDAAGRVFRLPETMEEGVASQRPQEVPFPLPAVDAFSLSETGCGRATAYDNANKIVTVGSRTHATWLDSVADGFRVRIRTLDNATGEWSPTYTVGEAHDNHGGPALTVDSEGYLHIVYFPHHHPIRYRRSLRPNDASAWTGVSQVGTRATYPALVCGPDDTLYLMVRESHPTEPWSCNLYRKPKGGEWTGPHTILRATVPGYCQFGQHLMVETPRRTPVEGAAAASASPWRLHASFWIYEDRDRLRTTIGYLVSDDGGDAWAHSDGTPMDLPGSSHTIEVIATTADPGVDVLRGGPMVLTEKVRWVPPPGSTEADSGSGDARLDPRGSDQSARSYVPEPTGQVMPSILYRSLSDWPSRLLIATRDHGGWNSSPLGPVSTIPGTILHSGSITTDESGYLFAALTYLDRDLEDPVVFWGHPSHGVAWHHRPSPTSLTGHAHGGSGPGETACIPRLGATTPSWLPSIERHTGHNRVDRPAFLYTVGGRGETNSDIVANRVVFERR